MEGIQTINALKAVQSSLPAQTTIPSGELVMLYAADGTPIAKIARDDLVKAVASVMASNSQTTFSKLLGVQANGTPMGIGPSDLASVLGANGQINNNTSFDSITYNGCWYAQNHPDSPSNATGILCCVFATKGSFGYQMFKTSAATFIRHYFGGWPQDWQRLDNFGCNTAADLASLLGVGRYSKHFEIPYHGKVDTGISINAEQGGRTLLVISSSFWDAGSSTASQVDMIWCGYSGNNWHVTSIATHGTKSSVEFSLSASNTLEIGVGSNLSNGISHALVISSKEI